ncbi:unnamed protein product [Litomosoides sigmodontis]|uniref:Uncharacterized protein n=1 Tax=Litomosoides sigmodontis TaxID=42156 RepID=A0A3P6VAM7_LITSI|nr:unnamed protein product [Litomosoides sigmodontis]
MEGRNHVHGIRQRHIIAITVSCSDYTQSLQCCLLLISIGRSRQGRRSGGHPHPTQNDVRKRELAWLLAALGGRHASLVPSPPFLLCHAHSIMKGGAVRGETQISGRNDISLTR